MSSAPEGRPLLGQSALVTGATAGIGYQTARALARSGVHVVVTGRKEDAGQQAAAAINRESGADSATFLRADHSTVGGNQELADHVRATVPRLDLLINNVGGLYPTRWETADGFEATLAMNFVGPYTLTAALVPLLRASAQSRCVSVVSAGFKMCNADPFTDVQSAGRFVSGDAYAQTKLLNVLASLSWARRLTGDGVTVNAVHPGMSWTQMTQSMTAETIPSMRLMWPLLRLLQRHGSPAKAGRRVAFVASSPQTVGHTGQYFEGRRKPSRLSARELDPDIQDRAWALGAELMRAAPHPVSLPEALRRCGHSEDQLRRGAAAASRQGVRVRRRPAQLAPVLPRRTEWDPPTSFRYTVSQVDGPGNDDNRRTFQPVAGGTRRPGSTEIPARSGPAGLVDRLQMLLVRVVFCVSHVPATARSSARKARVTEPQSGRA